MRSLRTCAVSSAYTSDVKLGCPGMNNERYFGEFIGTIGTVMCFGNKYDSLGESDCHFRGTGSDLLSLGL